MAEKIPPRFRKTKTEKWAVMAPVEDLEQALAAGGKIDVQKKSGDWSSFVVASLGNPFDVDGVQMCYGYGPDEEGEQSQSSGGNTARNRGTPPAVRRDPSEPLPEYQGGPEDEWVEF